MHEKNMKCPNCIEKMEDSNAGGLPTSECFYCEGVWIPSNTLVEIAIKETPKLDLRELFHKENKTCSNNRLCPECYNQLHKIEIQDIEIDLCFECTGIFFDKGEAASLLPKGSIPNQSESKGLLALDIMSSGLLALLVFSK